MNQLFRKSYKCRLPLYLRPFKKLCRRFTSELHWWIYFFKITKPKPPLGIHFCDVRNGLNSVSPLKRIYLHFANPKQLQNVESNWIVCKLCLPMRHPSDRGRKRANIVCMCGSCSRIFANAPHTCKQTEQPHKICDDNFCCIDKFICHKMVFLWIIGRSDADGMGRMSETNGQTSTL